MGKNYYTREQVIERLDREVEKRGNVRQFAIHHGLNYDHVKRALTGRGTLTADILKALGLQPQTFYCTGTPPAEPIYYDKPKPGLLAAAAATRNGENRWIKVELLAERDGLTLVRAVQKFRVGEKPALPGQQRWIDSGRVRLAANQNHQAPDAPDATEADDLTETRTPEAVT